MSSPGTPAFFINLDRETERARHMTRVLSRTELAAERFSAVDASEAASSPRYRPHSWGPYWELSGTEVAVFESHRALWARMIDQGVDAAVILEDDVLISEQFGRAVSALADCAGSFDLVKLDGVGVTARLGPEIDLAGQAARPILTVLPSAAAYMVSRRGAELLLAAAERYSDHLDDFITRPRPGWRLFQILPALAVQGMFSGAAPGPEVPPGIMGSARTGGQAPDVSKGPVTYRLWKDLRRTARRLCRTLGGDAMLVARGGMVGVVPLASDIGPYR